MWRKKAAEADDGLYSFIGYTHERTQCLHLKETVHSFALQGGAAYLAYQRFQAGADAAFSQGLGADDEGFGHQGDYGDDEESGPRYSDPPFSGGQTGKPDGD